MVEILPKGKTQITVSGDLKDKIANTDYTSQGVGIWLTKIVDDKDEEEMYEFLDNWETKLVQRYSEKLSKDLEIERERYMKSLEEIKETRNPKIDQIRLELSEQYDSKLKLAKKEILKLRKLLKDNGIQF